MLKIGHGIDGCLCSHLDGFSLTDFYLMALTWSSDAIGLVVCTAYLDHTHARNTCEMTNFVNPNCLLFYLTVTWRFHEINNYNEDEEEQKLSVG